MISFNPNAETITCSNLHGKADNIMILFIAQVLYILFREPKHRRFYQFAERVLTRFLDWIKEKEQKMNHAIGPVEEALKKSLGKKTWRTDHFWFIIVRMRSKRGIYERMRC